MSVPVLDLHCDMLFYLHKVPGASIMNSEEIGVSVPRLREGNVKTQVMAMYTPTAPGSTATGISQLSHFRNMTSEGQPFSRIEQAEDLLPGDDIGVLLSIENASGFAEEEGELDFTLLERYMSEAGPLAYISFTHHDENRFGGGNYSDNVGLKRDGEALLEWLDGKRVPVDFSHSSDALVEGILSYIDSYNLNIPVMASHSNFRPVCDHVRNLPDELAKEIIHRKGLIGINFLRAYIHDSDPGKLDEQVAYGWSLPGAESCLALGADFFSPVGFPWPERFPLFFEAHSHAGTYPALLEKWERQIPDFDTEAVASRNAMEFFRKALFSAGE